MLHTRGNVARDGGEVKIRNFFLLAEGPDDRSDLWVVHVRHAGEEMVLDLIVEPAVAKAQEGSSDV